jgi:signal transduction histidine kinase/phage shock protein PspC (stress-responsive transcriptional regulator)
MSTTSPAKRSGAGRFVRSRRDRLLTGAAGGLGARIGVDPVVLRILFVVLALAGGAGLILYAVAVLASDDPVSPEDEPTVGAFDLQQAIAVSLMGLGVLGLMRTIGVWFSDAIVWPALLAGVASAVLWARGEPTTSRAGDPLGASGPRSLTLGRIAVGLTLAVASGIVFLTSSDAPFQLLAPLLGLAVGAVLLLAPWLLRVWRQLVDEREVRAREEARAEVAAHLHDSVLQSLALIQRAADDPQRMLALARRQERELRAWLYGQRDGGDGDGRGDVLLSAAVDRLITEVEDGFALRVDPVIVGDTTVDGAVAALLAAIREALVNAARHAGVGEASLYLEVENTHVAAYVRDRGTGFDPDAVGTDRHGVRESIVGRVERVGGSATVTSTPGEGTEVAMVVPRVGVSAGDGSNGGDGAAVEATQAGQSTDGGNR